MLIAAIITGIMGVLPLVMALLYSLILKDENSSFAGSMMCGTVFAFLPLFATVVFLRNRKAVAQGCRTTSEMVRTVAVWQANYSAVLAFGVTAMTAMTRQGWPEAFLKPLPLSLFLGYILNGIACLIVVVLLTLCRREYPNLTRIG